MAKMVRTWSIDLLLCGFGRDHAIDGVVCSFCHDGRCLVMINRRGRGVVGRIRSLLGSSQENRKRECGQHNEKKGQKGKGTESQKRWKESLELSWDDERRTEETSGVVRGCVGAFR